MIKLGIGQKYGKLEVLKIKLAAVDIRKNTVKPLTESVRFGKFESCVALGRKIRTVRAACILGRLFGATENVSEIIYHGHRAFADSRDKRDRRHA